MFLLERRGNYTVLDVGGDFGVKIAFSGPTPIAFISDEPNAEMVVLDTKYDRTMRQHLNKFYDQHGRSVYTQMLWEKADIFNSKLYETIKSYAGEQAKYLLDILTLKGDV
jgi:hypothetical protein